MSENLQALTDINYVVPLLHLANVVSNNLYLILATIDYFSPLEDFDNFKDDVFFPVTGVHFTG